LLGSTSADYACARPNASIVCRCFSLGLGYAKYLNHPVYDRFLVSPGSELSFDLFVRDFRFSCFDRFSCTQDPVSRGAISSVANYGGLDNTLGATAAWDLNQAVFSAGCSHDNWISATAEFDYLNRASELFFDRAAFLPNLTTVVGLEASGSLTGYEPSLLSATGFSAGASAEWKLTTKFQVTPRAGYVSYRFDTGGPAGHTGNPSTCYFGLALEHVVNEYISHALEGGREVRLGVYSDFEELDYVRHEMTWRILKDVGLGTRLFYEHGDYPPFIFHQSGGRFITFSTGETYDRIGAAVSLFGQLMRKLRASVTCRFTGKASNMEFRGYTQNALTLDLTYQF
jgi:hypothetical protein